ncbi:hypothetical protein LTR37_008262 [Vermiconidia calcicola]|uniref:Uncharacterized protein n=1 Tax=Vermiconidia calcicola TaxID=1690605 RepID=A0ACC3NBL2_9PEZI|nr:hypothetical protein LTR37_008262 [Vermiconidia calcicola]
MKSPTWSRTKRPSTPSPSQSPLFRLRPELRVIIYQLLLQTCPERPLHFIFADSIWRCGPSQSLLSSGPPSLLLTCRQIAREACDVLDSSRELRLMVNGHQRNPCGGFPPYQQRVCKFEEFVPVLKRVRRMCLIVNIHDDPREGATFMYGLRRLDLVVRVLELRGPWSGQLRLSFECCFSMEKVRCEDGGMRLPERLMRLGPAAVEHVPWNGRCVWAQVCVNQAPKSTKIESRNNERTLTTDDDRTSAIQLPAATQQRSWRYKLLQACG